MHVRKLIGALVFSYGERVPGNRLEAGQKFGISRFSSHRLAPRTWFSETRAGTGSEWVKEIDYERTVKVRPLADS